MGARRALAAVAVLGLLAVGWLLFSHRSAPAPPRAPSAPPPRPASPPAQRPTPQPTATPAAVRRPTPPPAPTKASLHVDSDVAGASVFLDRRFVGNAPVSVDVEPGHHRLNVSAEGFEMQSQELDVATGEQAVQVRFREVRLDAAVQVVHRHGIGSCQGKLSATPAGLRYEAAKGDHSFAVPLDAVERLETEYLAKTLHVKARGKSYDFTAGQGPDALLAFQQQVEKARATARATTR